MSSNIVGLDGRTLEDNTQRDANPDTGNFMPPARGYIFQLKSGDALDAEGTLVCTGAFAAVITSPTNYELIAPWDSIEFVTVVDEADEAEAG